MVVPTIVPIILTVLYNFPLMVCNTLNMYYNHTIVNKPCRLLGQRQWGDDIHFEWGLIIKNYRRPHHVLHFCFCVGLDLRFDYTQACKESYLPVRTWIRSVILRDKDTLDLHVSTYLLRYTYTPVGGYFMNILHVRDRYRESDESIQ